MRKEERKFLLRKLCEYEPQTEFEVENVSKIGFTQPTAVPGESKKGKKKVADPNGKPAYIFLFIILFAHCCRT